MESNPFVTVAEAAVEVIEAIPTDAPEAQLHPIVHGLDAISVISAAMIGYIGVGVMMYGAGKGAMAFVAYCMRRATNLSHIRFELGKHLALGLEFFVGKDIIESVVHPSWDDLGKLGVIVLIRTILTVFLARELKEVEQEMKIEKMERKMYNRKTA